MNDASIFPKTHLPYLTQNLSAHLYSEGCQMRTTAVIIFHKKDNRSPESVAQIKEEHMVSLKWHSTSIFTLELVTRTQAAVLITLQHVG